LTTLILNFFRKSKNCWLQWLVLPLLMTTLSIFFLSLTLHLEIIQTPYSQHTCGSILHIWDRFQSFSLHFPPHFDEKAKWHYWKRVTTTLIMSTGCHSDHSAPSTVNMQPFLPYRPPTIENWLWNFEEISWVTSVKFYIGGTDDIRTDQVNVNLN
jgi:hypothetical protein